MPRRPGGGLEMWLVPQPDHVGRAAWAGNQRAPGQSIGGQMQVGAAPTQGTHRRVQVGRRPMMPAGGEHNLAGRRHLRRDQRIQDGTQLHRFRHDHQR